MPFNANTYRANRDAARARECMDTAREKKAAGAPAADVAEWVVVARGWMRLSRLERQLARAVGPAWNGAPK